VVDDELEADAVLLDFEAVDVVGVVDDVDEVVLEANVEVALEDAVELVVVVVVVVTELDHAKVAVEKTTGP